MGDNEVNVTGVPHRQTVDLDYLKSRWVEQVEHQRIGYSSSNLRRWLCNGKNTTAHWTTSGYSYCSGTGQQCLHLDHAELCCSQLRNHPLDSPCSALSDHHKNHSD